MNFLEKLKFRSTKSKLALLRQIIEEPSESEYNWRDRIGADCFRKVNGELVCFVEFYIPVPFRYSTLGVLYFQFIVFDSHFGYREDYYDGVHRSFGIGFILRINW